MEKIARLTPAFVRRTNSAKMYCASIPTITGCHWIALRLRDVAQNTNIKTARPNKLTARLARVLSAVVSLTKVPRSITATVTAARNGIFAFCGSKSHGALIARR